MRPVKDRPDADQHGRAGLAQTPPPPSHGAYGLRLEGVDGARRLLRPVPGAWPVLRIARGLPGPPDDPHAATAMDEERATIALGGEGVILVDRRTLVATLSLRSDPGDEEVVHPFLASAAVVVSYWLGREAFHAGAFVVDGGAWAVLGDKGSGKSSTLAWLASVGVGVATDDVLVVEDGHVLSGPGAVDLRPDAARRLGVGNDLGMVGARPRWRVVVPPVPARVALRGWVFLAWGPEVELVPVPAAPRLARVLGQRFLRLPPTHPERFLDLTSLPCFKLHRPHGLGSLASSTELLVRLASARSHGR